MQPHPPTYKPSPLSYGSPRTSPFKRPDSPASPFRRPDSPSSPSPMTTNRATTPTPTSPTKLQTTITATPPSESGSWTPRGGLNVTPSPLLMTTTTSRGEATSFPSPSRSETSSTATMTASHHLQPNNNAATLEKPPMMGKIGGGGGGGKPTRDALSQIPPPLVRELRECFQILDRDNDGLVTREDVADMLTNLGDAPPTTTTAAATFFPPSTPHPLPLPTYLSTLSTLLAPLSSRSELLNAFSAFDERDSGEVDVRELKDALTHTAQGGMMMSGGVVEEVVGGFVGRREFGREGGGARGEVFRYREWVGGLVGGEDRKGDGRREGER